MPTTIHAFTSELVTKVLEADQEELRRMVNQLLSSQVGKEIVSLLLRPRAIRDDSVLRRLVVSAKVGLATSTSLYEYFLSAIKTTGALSGGHFELLSGRHSDYFVTFSRIGSMPRYRNLICGELARRLASTNPDLVMGPVTAGGLLVSYLAEVFRVRSAYFDLDSASRPAAVRASYSVISGSRVLIVNDLATTGEGLERMVQIVEHYGAHVVGVGLFATRGKIAENYLRQIAESLSIPIEVLIHFNIESATKSECKSCEITEAVPYLSCLLNS